MRLRKPQHGQLSSIYRHFVHRNTVRRGTASFVAQIRPQPSRRRKETYRVGRQANTFGFRFLLDDAAADGNLDLVKLLVENGVASNYVNAFKLAIDRKHNDIIKYFIDYSLTHGPLRLDTLPNFIEYKAEHLECPADDDYDDEWDSDDF